MSKITKNKMEAKESTFITMNIGEPLTKEQVEALTNIVNKLHRVYTVLDMYRSLLHVQKNPVFFKITYNMLANLYDAINNESDLVDEKGNIKE